METLIIMAIVMIAPFATRTKFSKSKIIEVNDLRFKLVITGYTYLFVFSKTTSVDIISSNVTLNINL